MDKDVAIVAGITEGMASAVALLVKSLEEAKVLSKGTYAAKLRRHLRYTKKDVLPTR